MNYYKMKTYTTRKKTILWTQTLLTLRNGFFFTILSCIYFTFFVPMPMISSGLVRFCFMAKTGCRLAACIIRSVLSKIILEKQAVTFAFSKSPQPSTTEIASDSCSNLLKHFHELFDFMDLFLSFVLLHELFVCVTKMEVKKRQIGNLMKKIAVIGLIALVIASYKHLSILVNKEHIWFHMILQSSPHTMLIKLIVSAACFYYGYHIFRTLKESANFHQANGVKGSNKFHLKILVLLVISMQTLKFMCVFKVAFQFLILRDTMDCSKLVFKHIFNCFRKMRIYDYVAPLIDENTVGVFEPFFVTIILIHKKYVNYQR